MTHQTGKIFMLSVLLTVFSLSAMAQPPHMMPGPERGRAMGPAPLPELLNLTEDQQTQIQNLRFKQQQTMIDLRAELASARLELRKQRLADEPNRKKLYSRVEKVSAVKTKMEKARVDHQLAMRDILTPDQYKIFRQQVQQHNFANRPDHRTGFGHKPGRGRCPDRF